MRPIPTPALAWLIALAIAALPGCRAAQPDAPGAPVAIVGIDGGDWDILDYFIAQGRLPNLARMRQQGATARLDIESPLSPESWTSLATGHPPAIHGIVQAPSSDGSGFFAPPDALNVKRVWDMAGDQGKSVLVVDYWVTEPAYPVNGVLIAREGDSAYPSDARLDQGTPIDPREELAEMQRLGFVAPRTGNMLAWMERARFDLLLLPIYCHDQALHSLWSEFETVASGVPSATLDEQVGPGTAERVRRGHEIVAQAADIGDRLLGAALEYVGEDGFVILVSDHGHTRAGVRMRRIALARSLFDGLAGTVESGTLTMATDDGSAFVTLTPVEADARIPVETLAYQLRYPELRIDGPGAALARARLLALRTETGDPLLAETPFGTLIPSTALFIAARDALGQVQEHGFSVFVNSGAHGYSDQGIFGLLGPGVATGELPMPVRSLDVTPTALWLLGLPVPADLPGAPVTGAFPATELARRPITPIPTYEDGTRPWATGAIPQVSPEDIERLKALGYIQ